MVTTNQKLITDIRTIKRKEYKHNTKENHQITRGESKRRRREQRGTTKITRKQFTKMANGGEKKILLVKLAAQLNVG